MSTLVHPHITCVWGDFLIGLDIGVRALNLRVKLSKQLVNALIIFITSIIPGSPFRSLDGSPAQFLLSFLSPRDLGAVALLIALSF